MRRRKLRLIASTLTTLGLVLSLMAGLAGAAAAATCYNNNGNPPVGGPPDQWKVPDSVWYCHYLPNGNLCLRYINNYTGVDIHYDKNAGGTITAYFSYVDLVSDRTHCGGPFTESPGETKSFAWNNVNPPPDMAIVGWMNVDGQGPFNTPVLHRNAQP